MDLHIQQGADYHVDLPVLDGNSRPRILTGWTARAAIRLSPDSALLATPTVTVLPGLVRLSIPGVRSAQWTWRRAMWEVLLVGPKGERERLAAGRVHLDRSLM